MLDIPENELVLLLEGLSAYHNDPLGFVEAAFPWGQGELSRSVGPEPWQREVLTQIGTGLSPDEAIRIARASGHGIGKSALIAWIILWGLSTCVDARIIITANTEVQLRTKTWPELAKWHRMFVGRALFKLEATSLISVDADHTKTWRCDMVPWSEHNPEAFAGLHNQGRRAMMLYDEASGIADIIWETSEGFMSDADTERLWIVFGNPTKSTGRFRECFPGGSDKFAHLWSSAQIDARQVSFTNKPHLADLIDNYGDDSDYVRVRILGVFPRIGATEFISAAIVAEARIREVEGQLFDPLVMGVDVARFGDDSTVIAFRKGRDARTWPAIHLHGLDTMQVAARIVSEAERLNVDAVFIDEGGVGGGVVDRCRQLRLFVVGIQFGGKADRSDFVSQGERYKNKVAEMMGALRAWLPGGAIEDSDELRDQLVGRTYGFSVRDEIQLERKEDMKKRGVKSPDWAEALGLTFAYPVMPNEAAGGLGRRTGASTYVSEYNPFEYAEAS